jgi:hypothetical protein
MPKNFERDRENVGLKRYRQGVVNEGKAVGKAERVARLKIFGLKIEDDVPAEAVSLE